MTYKKFMSLFLLAGSIVSTLCSCAATDSSAVVGYVDEHPITMEEFNYFLSISYPDSELEVLDYNMVKNPKEWMHHYSGNGLEIKLQRKYSLSDRARYYMPKEEVNYALEKLMNNLKDVNIPITLISQYMHEQYKKIRDGLLKPNAEALLKDKIGEYIDDYIYAIEDKK